MSEFLDLSEEQREKIRVFWNSPANEAISIDSICKHIFPGEDVDLRSKKAICVKNFVAKEFSVDPSKLQVVEYSNQIREVVLTPEHREFIRNNCKTLKVSEMANQLFSNGSGKKLSPASKEIRAVTNYVEIIENEDRYEDPESVSTEDYKAPKTIKQAISLISEHIKIDLDESKLTGKQQKDLNALIKYLGNVRFKQQMNSLASKKERELFENSFIRCTWDKNDLEPEDVDQYIILANEAVIQIGIQKHIKDLQSLLDIEMEKDDPRLRMPLVEAISKARTEYNECIKRQGKIAQDLGGKRSDKLLEKGKDQSTLINFVQLWKEEETRKQIVKIADSRKELIKKEIDRLSNIDQLKCLLSGVTEEEVLNG